MWQFYSLGSLLTGAFESAVDKAGIVGDRSVDSYAASFYRSFFFACGVVLVGFSGILGEMQFVFHWSFLALAILGVISTLLFTYLLRTVEITAIMAASYLTPLAFLFIDTHVINVGLTQSQILGIFLLIAGGFAFSLDGKTQHFKRELNLGVIGSFLFIFVLNNGIENYAFKYFSDTGMTGVTFFAGVYPITAALLFLLIVVHGKMHSLVTPASRKYIPYAIFGKSFDTFNTLLMASALALANVSQVTAFNALYPLMVFVVVAIAQSVFRIKLRERLDRGNATWKLGAAVVLVVGGLLVG